MFDNLVIAWKVAMLGYRMESWNAKLSHVKLQCFIWQVRGQEGTELSVCTLTFQTIIDYAPYMSNTVSASLKTLIAYNKRYNLHILMGNTCLENNWYDWYFEWSLDKNKNVYCHLLRQFYYTSRRKIGHCLVNLDIDCSNYTP